MRILAIHGMGTNGAIFEAQLSRICATLEDHGHELVFVDGQIDCAGAQGTLASPSSRPRAFQTIYMASILPSFTTPRPLKRKCYLLETLH